MIVSIDATNQGYLTVATEEYDHCVAGVISGAGDIDPGVILKHDELINGQTYPVALSGRVYCLADASYGIIQPGDLLTTSNTPGYAMKVTDYNKSNGAIIGKAMTSLEQGKGVVLMLILSLIHI